MFISLNYRWGRLLTSVFKYSLFLYLIAIPLRGDDFEVIQARIVEDFREANETVATVLNYRLNSQLADGSWPDIDYEDTSGTPWEPVQHLQRLLDLASGYRTETHELFGSVQIEQAIEKGLEFWFTKKPWSGNWWWNDIGALRELGPVLLMMESVLPNSLIQLGIEELADKPSLTGQNRMWISNLVIIRGLLEKNAERVGSGVEAISSTVFITTEEGIQVDGSFYQHGDLIYNGGYGLAYVVDVARWVQYLRGTAYTLEGEASDILAKLILEGTGWMVWKDDIDYSVIGREIARSNKLNSANTLIEPLEQMITLEDAYQDQYQALLDHITVRKEPYRVGHKHFWRADYTVNRQESYMVSLRMFSNRTVGGELINNENKLGLYLPFGTTFIYRTGTEYDEIMPQWNWNRLPGTTLEQNIRIEEYSVGIGQTDFVGGVTNGKKGMSAFDISHWTSKVTARKSWFFFEEGFVALGTDIRSSGTNSVFTTVNQCRLLNQRRAPTVFAHYGEETANIPNGERTLEGTSWIYHNGVGYVFPEKNDVYLRNEEETGSWNLINSSHSTTPVPGEVLTIGIDHGVLASPADYVYYVLPIGSNEAVTSFAENDPIRVLSNTKTLQAVQHLTEGSTGITFYEPGSLVVEPGLSLTVDTACLVLIEKKGGSSEIEISVANPVATEASVKLKVSGYLTGTNTQYLAGEDVTEIVFDLPGGAYGGSSITETFAILLDYDNDEMADQWERAYFNTLSHNGTEDQDDDHYTDLNEFIGGTSPLNHSDYPLIAIDVNSAGSAYLSFEAKANVDSDQDRYYQIEGQTGDWGEWSVLDGYDRILGEDQFLEIPLNTIPYDFYRLNIWLE